MEALELHPGASYIMRVIVPLHMFVACYDRGH